MLILESKYKVMALKKGYEYSFNGNGIKDCYFMTNEEGYPICLINGFKKTVSPVHGYYPPNIEAARIKKLAKDLGYEFKDH